MQRARLRQAAIFALVLGIYLLVVGRSVAYDFVWDDVHEIARNPQLDRPLFESLTTTQTERTNPELTELSTIQLAYDSFRPALFTTYWIDVRLWGRSAAAMHAINVALGALAIAMAYLLSRQCVGPRLAWIPTAIFALHPIQIEAVAYISGRGDLLAGLFAMVCTASALAASETARRGHAVAWGAVATVMLAGSLLSKETCIALPVAIAALLAARGAPSARAVPIVASLTVVVVAYLLARSQLVASTATSAAVDGLTNGPAVVLSYLRILALPFDLSTERLFAGSVVLGWSLTALVLIAFVLAWRARMLMTQRTRVAVAGCVWFVVLLGPSAIAIASTGVVADRYAYTAVLGAAIAATAVARSLWPRLSRIRAALVVAAAGWSLLALFIGVRQVPVWRDNHALYEHAVTMAPDSTMAHYRRGYLDAVDGAWDAAIERFTIAVELDPANVRALNNLGVAFMRTRRFEEAARVMARAVSAQPAHYRAWHNLGVALVHSGDRVEGCRAITRALEINSTYEAARRSRAQHCTASTP